MKMKVNIILCKTLLITILIVICNYCISYAKDPNLDSPYDTIDETFEGDSMVSGDSSTGLPEITKKYKPQVNLGDNATNAVGKVLGVFNVIGAIVIVITIALIGFNTILGSASEKAAAQEKYVGILIATAVLTGGSVLAKIIITAVEKF